MYACSERSERFFLLLNSIREKNLATENPSAFRYPEAAYDLAHTLYHAQGNKIILSGG